MCISIASRQAKKPSALLRGVNRYVAPASRRAGKNEDIHRAIGETVAFGLALILSSNVALAQSRNPQKRPTIGGKPIVQAKPSATIGCKPVGTVKGTKLWAGECIAAPELRTTTMPEDKAPTPSPETQTVPKGQE
jgi:hypothetical protein